eukprot:GEMP01034922.1.p2 GENE.GEMP01034922.1~~GEMP01034922.1.p2  ORF type:complete len:158 (+),score=24.47 GEMP01034922.1:352-825(+)
MLFLKSATQKALFVTYRFTRHAATQTEWPQDHAMTEKSAEVGLQVRRGLHWQWGGEDGCIGQGIVVKVKGSRATVRWQDDTIIRVYSHYRLGPRNFDLCHAAPPSVDQHVQTEMTKSVLVRKVSFTDYPDPEPCGADTPEWEDIASSRSDMLVRRGE